MKSKAEIIVAEDLIKKAQYALSQTEHGKRPKSGGKRAKEAELRQKKESEVNNAKRMMVVGVKQPQDNNKPKKIKRVQSAKTTTNKRQVKIARPKSAIAAPVKKTRPVSAGMARSAAMNNKLVRPASGKPRIATPELSPPTPAQQDPRFEVNLTSSFQAQEREEPVPDQTDALDLLDSLHVSPIDMLKAEDSDSIPEYIHKGQFDESPKITKKKRHQTQGYLQAANNIRQTALSASPRFRSPHFAENEPECMTRGTKPSVKRNLAFTPSDTTVKAKTARRSTDKMQLSSELSATRDVFKKLMQSQELKRSQQERKSAELREAMKQKKMREYERIRQMNQVKQKASSSSLKSGKSGSGSIIPQITSAEHIRRFEELQRAMRSSQTRLSQKSITPPKTRSSKKKATPETRDSRDSVVSFHPANFRIITYDYKKQKPKEINVKMPEVSDNRDLNFTEMAYMSMGAEAQQEENIGPNNNDRIERLKIPLTKKAPSVQDNSTSLGMLEPREVIVSAPETPSKRSSEIKGAMSLQKILANMADVVHEKSEKKKSRTQIDEMDEDSGLREEEVKRILQENDERLTTGRERTTPSPYSRMRLLEEVKRSKVMRLIKKQQKKHKQLKQKEEEMQMERENKIQQNFRQLEEAYRRNTEIFKKQQQSAKKSHRKSQSSKIHSKSIKSAKGLSKTQKVAQERYFPLKTPLHLISPGQPLLISPIVPLQEESSSSANPSLQLTGQVEGIMPQPFVSPLHTFSPPPAQNISEIPMVPRDKITPHFESEEEGPRRRGSSLKQVSHSVAELGDFLKQTSAPLSIHASSEYTVKKKQELYKRLKNFAQRFKKQAQHLEDSANQHLEQRDERDEREEREEPRSSVSKLNVEEVEVEIIDTPPSPDQLHQEGEDPSSSVLFNNQFIKRRLTDPTSLYKWNQGFCRLTLLIMQHDKRAGLQMLKEMRREVQSPKEDVEHEQHTPKDMTPKEVSTINFGDSSDSFFGKQDRPIREDKLEEPKFDLFAEPQRRSREAALTGEGAGKSTTSSGKWGKVVSKIVEELKDPATDEEKVKEIEEEEVAKQKQIEGDRLSLGLRTAFGSEQAVRETSGFVIQRFSQNQEEGQELKHLEISSESIFQHTAFDDFKHKQIQKLLDPKNMEEFLTDLEKQLELKVEEKTLNIENMFGKELISPRGREARIQQVKLWQEKKKKELKRTKNYLVGGWKRIQPLIEQIHSDKLSVQSIIGESIATPKAVDMSSSLPFTQAKGEKESFEVDMISESPSLELKSASVDEKQKSISIPQEQVSCKQPEVQEVSHTSQGNNSMAVLEMIDDGDNFLQSGELKDEMVFQQRGMESNQVPVKPQVSTPKEQCEDDEPSKPLFVKSAKELEEPLKKDMFEADEIRAKPEVPKIHLEKVKEEKKEVPEEVEEVDFLEQKESLPEQSETNVEIVTTTLTPAAPPYTPQYSSEEASVVKGTSEQPRLSSDEILENILMIPPHLDDERPSASSRTSESPPVQVSLASPVQEAGNKEPPSNGFASQGHVEVVDEWSDEKREEKREERAKLESPREKKVQEEQKKGDEEVAGRVDSVDSSDGDLESDFDKISELVVTQLKEIYIEDMIKGSILRIVGLDESLIVPTGADPRNFIIESSQDRDPSKSQNSLEVMFKDLKKEKEAGPPGIDTTLNLVKRYIERVYSEIRSKKEDLYSNLSTPLLRDPLQILCHLQNAEAEYDPASGNGENFLTQQSVLAIDLYLDIERSRKDKGDLDWAEGRKPKTKEEEQQQEMDAREWENIHNKAVFDALNQAFDSYRPFGLKGPPLPWSRNTRTLTFKHSAPKGFDKLLETVKQKVCDWAQTRAGTIKLLPEDREIEEEEAEEAKNNKGEENEQDKVNLVREEKLAVMLADEVDDGEQLWLDYEYEETQTKLDLADMVLEHLAGEAVDFFKEVETRRSKREE